MTKRIGGHEPQRYVHRAGSLAVTASDAAAFTVVA